MRKQLFVLGFVVLLGALWSSASAASAQEKVDGTGWYGREDRADFGKLEFELHRDGKAVMHDVYKGNTRANIQGKWSQKGASVVITFADCEYLGNVADKRITGTARFTSGQDRTTWKFRVERLGLIP